MPRELNYVPAKQKQKPHNTHACLTAFTTFTNHQIIFMNFRETLCFERHWVPSIFIDDHVLFQILSFDLDLSVHKYKVSVLYI